MVTEKCVNALTRAYPISTATSLNVKAAESDVSMPLLGLIPFLRSRGFRNYRSRSRCQCPYSGLSHFYPTPEVPEIVVTPVCQCPYSGLSHFYGILPFYIDETINCVNALTRAYPISTVSLPKPFKINGFRVRFQGVIVRKF